MPVTEAGGTFSISKNAAPLVIFAAFLCIAPDTIKSEMLPRIEATPSVTSSTPYHKAASSSKTGQINSGTGAVTNSTTRVPSNWSTWLANNSTNRYQVTNTVYDEAEPSGIATWLTQNPSTLRSRVWKQELSQCVEKISFL